MEKQKRLSHIVLIIYYGFTLCAAIYALRQGAELYTILLAAAAFLLPLVPFLVYRVLHLRRVPLLEIVLNLFVLSAVPFASLFGGYELIPLWDKILHFLSGFLFATLGMIIYFCKKPGRRLDPADAFNASAFSWMFAVWTAAIWEFWEYFVSFSGADPQQVATTGVGDTMQDMIVCALGGLITAVSCFKYVRGKKEGRGLMMRLFDSFYKENIERKE